VKYWDGGAPLTLILVATLLAIAALVRTGVPGVKRLSVPDSMLAGFLGLLLGPSVLAVLPLDQDVLATVVYHGLALLFITVSLRPPQQGNGASTGVRGFAFALPMLVATQALLGLGLALLWPLFGRSLHPGVGLMVPLGFSQGPGQALALGTAWQDGGMEDGAQLGLIMAALGFVFCVGLGAPLLALARHRGWLDDPTGDSADDPEPVAASLAVRGGLEPLTAQLAAIGCVYLASWGVIQLVVFALGDRPQAVATVYGFHFLIGSVLALSTRRLLGGLGVSGSDSPLDGRLLARISALVVDVVTVSAIAAVKVSIIAKWWGIVLVFGTLGGVATAVLALWMARRTFPVAPFEYALVLFGAATGTLATGLALLRLIDPELKGSVPTGAVLGAAASMPLSIPLLGLLQVPAAGWPDTHPTYSYAALGILVVYAIGLMAAWRIWGGFRLLRPITSFWPDEHP
jgi:ESS family glutamate:Na+ symporter